MRLENSLPPDAEGGAGTLSGLGQASKGSSPQPTSPRLLPGKLLGAKEFGHRERTASPFPLPVTPLWGLVNVCECVCVVVGMTAFILCVCVAFPLMNYG